MQTARRQLQKLKKVHAWVAPLVIVPIILTLTTGSIYQALLLAGRANGARWLMSIHKGHFGPVNLEAVYPFLNALGLLFMAVTGGSMWLELRRIRSRHNRSQ